LIADEAEISVISDALRETCRKLIEHTGRFADLPEVLKNTGIGSVVYAVKPGDGSAREQAASCQKVLGGWANIAVEYATKRYRSNLVNWGMLPFTVDKEKEQPFTAGELVFIPDIQEKLEKGDEAFTAFVIGHNSVRTTELYLKKMTADEREIILKGSLINYYAEA